VRVTVLERLRKGHNERYPHTKTDLRPSAPTKTTKIQNRSSKLAKNAVIT